MPDHGPPPTQLKVGDFIIDRDDERLIGPSGPVKLGNKAFQLLNLFADHAGKLVTKDFIFSKVWDGTFVSESALTSTIKELRRALGDLSRKPSYIESVYGRGYRLIAPVGEAEGTTKPVRPVTAPAAAATASAFEKTSGDPPVIIVSDFNDAAIRQSMPYMGAGLREEILSSLAQFREIQLVANSHFDERNPQVSAPDRSYHLTATLLPDRDSAKLLVRTKRVSDGLVLWAENMLLKDLGAAAGVDRIVKRIAASLLPAVDHDLIAGVSRHGANLFDRYLIAKRTVFSVANYDDAKRAADELEAIIAERPDFALAYGPLVRLYNTDFFFTAPGISRGALRTRAMELAKAGLAADSSHAHNYSVMGWCMFYARKYDRAEEFFEEVLERNPYNYDRLNEVATAMTFLGRFERAHDLFAACHDMAPWDDEQNLEDEGRLHLAEGNFDAAHATLSSMSRSGAFSQLLLGLAEQAMGLPDGDRNVASWKDKIVANWRGPEQPTDGVLRAWVSDYLQFRGDVGRPLINLVDQAFA